MVPISPWAPWQGFPFYISSSILYWEVMIFTCLAFFSIVCVYQERGSTLWALLQVLACFLLLLVGIYLELRETEVNDDLWTPDLAGIRACARMLCFVPNALSSWISTVTCSSHRGGASSNHVCLLMFLCLLIICFLFTAPFTTTQHYKHNKYAFFRRKKVRQEQRII